MDQKDTQSQATLLPTDEDAGGSPHARLWPLKAGNCVRALSGVCMNMTIKNGGRSLWHVSCPR